MHISLDQTGEWIGLGNACLINNPHMKRLTAIKDQTDSQSQLFLVINSTHLYRDNIFGELFPSFINLRIKQFRHLNTFRNSE